MGLYKKELMDQIQYKDMCGWKEEAGEMEEARSQGMQAAFRSWKKQEIDSPLERSEKNRPC